MSEITLIATLTPKEGKADRVQELLTEMAKKVHAAEPDVLRYQVHRQTGVDGTPVLIMLETYKNEAAFKAHGTTEHMKKLGGTFQKEDILAKPFEVVRCSPVGGYASRL